MSTTDSSQNAQDRSYEGHYPMDFNGYAIVARPTLRVRADQVLEGDLLILDTYISRVAQITKRVVDGMDCLHIKGSLNIIRFPHEVISVLR